MRSLCLSLILVAAALPAAASETEFACRLLLSCESQASYTPENPRKAPPSVPITRHQGCLRLEMMDAVSTLALPSRDKGARAQLTSRSEVTELSVLSADKNGIDLNMYSPDLINGESPVAGLAYLRLGAEPGLTVTTLHRGTFQVIELTCEEVK